MGSPVKLTNDSMQKLKQAAAELTDIQRSILKDLFEYQCDEVSGALHDDETPLLTYGHFVDLIKRPKPFIKPHMIDLRDKGFVKLSMAVDYDYQPNGSAWMLTEDGASLCVHAFGLPTTK